MDTERFIELLRADTAVMSRVAHASELTTDVPTCPGWDIRELVVHTGVVHRHKVATLLGGYTEGPAPRLDTPDDTVPDSDVLAWFDEGTSLLLDACSTVDLDEPTWTWCPHDHTKDWWVRRMAHETVIHRADAEIAAGLMPTIDPWLGEDGIDEILDEFMLGGPPWGKVAPTDRTVKLSAGDRDWTLRTAIFSGTSPHSGKTYDALDTLVYDSEMDPMATVTATPAILDLWLWGRGDLPDGAVTGDRAMADLVRQRAAEATG